MLRTTPAAVRSRVISRTKDLSIFNASMGRERNSASEECPIPKSSSAVLTPISRKEAISRDAISGSSSTRGLGDFNTNQASVAAGSLKEASEPFSRVDSTEMMR